MFLKLSQGLSATGPPTREDVSGVILDVSDLRVQKTGVWNTLLAGDPSFSASVDDLDV